MDRPRELLFISLCRTSLRLNQADRAPQQLELLLPKWAHPRQQLPILVIMHLNISAMDLKIQTRTTMVMELLLHSRAVRNKHTSKVLKLFKVKQPIALAQSTTFAKTASRSCIPKNSTSMKVSNALFVIQTVFFNRRGATDLA